MESVQGFSGKPRLSLFQLIATEQLQDQRRARAQGRVAGGAKRGRGTTPPSHLLWGGFCLWCRPGALDAWVHFLALSL